MLYLLLFALFSPGVNGLNCPAGYTDDGDGNCQTGLLNPASQMGAYGKCATDNGYLPVVQNAFENTNLKTLLSGYPYMWLGLTCTGSTNTSCIWDTGVAISNGSYSNFAPGHPNVDIGACVYFYASNNFWYSSDCYPSSRSYICKISSGIDIISCPPSTYYFQGKCYYPVYALHPSIAESKCINYCGNTVSIHNSGENSFARDIAALNGTSLLYAYIGLSCLTDTCQWNDGTQYNYDAFGIINPGSLGSCVFMATTGDDLVSRGQWISTDCFENGISICKRDPTCVIPTQSPEECSGLSQLSGVGEIKSPGYPRGAIKNHCQYLISQSIGFGVTLSFPELSLDAASTIKIYNSMTDTTPFATITSTTPANSTTYYSSDTIFRIVFDTPGNTDFKDLWRAEFGAYRQGLNNCGAIYVNPGTIAGPHYSQNCTYNLKIGSRKTCLRFTAYGVQPGDSVAIYDGEVDPENNIAYLTYLSSTPVQLYLVLCTTNASYMNLVTTGQSGRSYEMFTVIVADSPDSIKNSRVITNYNYDQVVPISNYGNLQYTNYYSYAYRLIAASGQRVNAVFSILNMPGSNNLAILDGSFDSQIALAYGSPTKMRYQSSQQYMTVCPFFSQSSSLGYPIGFKGNFTAI